jgi:hypothetical protein
MPEDRSPNNSSGKQSFAALGIGALMIGCCAGVPLIAALASSVAIGMLLGVGGGILAAVALVTLAVIRVRARRRACAPTAPNRQPALDARR